MKSTIPKLKVSKDSQRMQEKFVIRMPYGLRTKIQHSAARNHRSMNSELLVAIERHLEK